MKNKVSTTLAVDSTEGTIATLKQVPEWLRDNDYILSGYRIAFSFRKCVVSIFELHNESVNIWTHAIGALFFVLLVFYLAFSSFPLGFVHLFDRFSHIPNVVSQVRDVSMRPTCPSSDLISAINKSFCTNIHPEFKQHETILHVIYHQLTGHVEVLEKFLGTHLSPIADSITDVGSRGYDTISDVSSRGYHTLEAYSDNIEDALTSLKSSLDNFCASCPFPHEQVDQAKEKLLKAYMLLSESVSEVPDHILDLIHKVKSLQIASVNIVVGNPPGSQLATWPIVVFLISAALTLFFSATFHCFYVHSSAVLSILQRLDYAGISFLIFGSSVPMIYYGLYCHIGLIIVYTTLIGISTAIAFYFNVSETMMKAEFRGYRFGAYVVSAFMGVIPVIHMMLSVDKPPVLVYLIVMGASYITGGLLYANRVPECWYPGHFDHFFSSHQIFHVLVVTAAIVHYVGIIRFYEWRQLIVCH